MRHNVALLIGFACFACALGPHPVRADDVDSNLLAGVSEADITPPPDTPVIGHPRKTSGARDPIRAAVLLLDDGKTKAAIATFDLIGATDPLVTAVRDVVHEQAGVPRENILVAASHNHS